MKYLTFKRYKRVNILVVCCLLFVVAPMLTSAATIKNAGRNGLVGYWSMSEGVGTEAGDASGFKNSGSLIGSPLWVVGKIGKALSFNGSSSYVDAGNKIDTSNITAMTISAWVYNNAVAANKGVAGWWNGTNGIFIQNETSATDGVVFIAGGGTSFGTVHYTTVNRWTHVTLVYDGSLTGDANRLKGYVDGVQQTLTFAGGAIPASFATSGNLIIGNVNSLSRFWNGKIDEVKVYNRALPASEVLSLYKSSGGTTIKSMASGKTGLVGYWPMNESVGTQADDVSGLKNNGTLVNGLTWVAGKIGAALSFNGTNNYVRAPSIDSSGTNVVSVSWWMYKSSFNNSISIIAETSADFNLSTTGWVIGPDDNTGYFAVGLKGNVGYSIPYYNRPSARVWHHYVAILDKSKATDEVSFYIDGVFQTPATYVTYNANNTNNFGNDVFYMGMRGGVQYPLAGKLDDMRIYNRALSVSEILDLYKSGGQGVVSASKNNVLTSGLVGLWSFDGKDINWGTNTVYDRSGQGNNGTLTSMNMLSSPVIGKIGQALRFNGSNYVALSAVNPPSYATVSGWFKRNGPSSNTHHILFMQDVQLEISIPESTGQLRTGVSTVTLGRRVIDSGSGLTDNNWHFLSFTYDGAMLRAYIDGVETGTLAVTGALSTGGSTNIGNYATYYANASIDDIRVYNRALSAAEVKNLYNLGR